jgi:flagellar motor switch protein FliG
MTRPIRKRTRLIDPPPSRVRFCLKVLFVTNEKAPEIGEFIFSNISTRMANQLREELGKATAVRRKNGEQAQTEIIRVIRDLVANGEIELVEEDEAEG